MIRVLVVGMTNIIGGLETFVINYLERLAGERVRFDVLCRFPDCAFSEKIERLGGRVFSVTRRSKNPARFYAEIHAFFRDHGGEYDVIWDNECMFNDVTPLRLAKRAGIPVRIAHSHNAGNMDVSLKGRIQEALHYMHRRGIARVATDFWACSGSAGEWAFPDAVRAGARYRRIPNAIDTRRFAFSPEARAVYRESLGLGERFTIGHVGRLQYQKNQMFLLEAFARLLRWEGMGNARLLLAGDGPEAEALRRRAEALNIGGSIEFLGFCADTVPVFQAMDVFALPSRFEGLGIVALEAQCGGLPCLVSSAVPREVMATDLVEFLPIDDPAVWADAFARLAAKRHARRARDGEVADAGFDIDRAAEEVLRLLHERTGKGTQL